MATIQDLVNQYTRAQQQAKAANEARYKELLGIADEVETLFGKDYGAGFKAELERAKTRDMASSMQGLVSSGLGGTTRGAGLGKKWEEEVGVPSRLKLEDMIAEKQFGAKQFKAGIIERRTDEYPDYNSLMQAVSSMSSVPQGVATSPQNLYSQNLFHKMKDTTPTYIAPIYQPQSYGQVAPTYQTQSYGPALTTGGGLRYSPQYGLGVGVVPGPTTRATGYNTTRAKPTATEKRKITSNLQRMYPQMYNANGTLKKLYGGK